MYCLWTYKKQENYFEIRARTTFCNKLCWRFLYLCQRFWSISIWFFFFFLNEKIFVDVNITPKVEAKSCDSVENTFPRYWQKEERTADRLRKKNFVFFVVVIYTAAEPFDLTHRISSTMIGQMDNNIQFIIIYIYFFNLFKISCCLDLRHNFSVGNKVSSCWQDSGNWPPWPCLQRWGINGYWKMHTFKAGSFSTHGVWAMF